MDLQLTQSQIFQSCLAARTEEVKEMKLHEEEESAKWTAALSEKEGEVRDLQERLRRSVVEVQDNKEELSSLSEKEGGVVAIIRDLKFAALAVNVPPVQSRVRRLSGGQRQAVAICRAQGFSSNFVIMDEPTAALGVQESAKVEELILKLRDDGHAVLLISHNFDQVIRLSDQVWVMRASRCVGGRRTAETTGQEIVALVTGALAA